MRELNECEDCGKPTKATDVWCQPCYAKQQKAKASFPLTLLSYDLKHEVVTVAVGPSVAVMVDGEKAGQITLCVDGSLKIRDADRANRHIIPIDVLWKAWEGRDVMGRNNGERALVDLRRAEREAVGLRADLDQAENRIAELEKQLNKANGDVLGCERAEIEAVNQARVLETANALLRTEINKHKTACDVRLDAAVRIHLESQRQTACFVGELLNHHDKE